MSERSVILPANVGALARAPENPTLRVSPGEPGKRPTGGSRSFRGDGVKRTRSYHDLSPDERARYDRLRSLQRRLNDPSGIRAKRLGSRAQRRLRLKEAADAMLGLTPEPDIRVAADETAPRTTWRGSSLHHLSSLRGKGRDAP